VPEPSTFLVFLAATIALLVVPGPVVIFVVTRSITQGRIAGLVSVLGVHTGSVVHVAAAALGISALLAASATAFGVVKYLGAAYLIFLGLQRLLRRGHDDEVVDFTPTPRAHLYRQGIVVNVFNPKTAIFFLAFLPQGLASDSAYALLSGTVSGRLRRSASVRRHLDRVSGVIYLGLGATAALAGEGGRRA